MTFDPATKQAKPKGGQRRDAKAAAATAPEAPVAEESSTLEGEIGEGSTSEPDTATDGGEPPAPEPEAIAPPIPPAAPPAPDPAIVVVPTHAYFGPGKHASVHVDLQLSRRRAAALAVAWQTLASLNERYKNDQGGHPDGTVVNNKNGGINWLLDRIADHIETTTGKDLIQDFGFIFYG